MLSKKTSENMECIKRNLKGIKNEEVKFLLGNIFLFPLWHGNCFHIRIMYKPSQVDGCSAGGNGSEKLFIQSERWLHCDDYVFM